jgi:epoxyqueuosine reductase
MSTELTQSLKAEARDAGFDLVGVCAAVKSNGFANFLQWLERGYAGEMGYLEQRKAAYEHPAGVLDGCKSVVMLGMSYHRVESQKSKPGFGKVAKYAWGECDYHDLIHERLKKLVSRIKAYDESIAARGVVDTAPLLEREFAQLAGLGWQGKNTLLLNRDLGSWFFLAAVLLDVELDYDEPFEQDHCGTCTACLDACPTNAFPAAGVLDARKCISYLTIEHRSPIDPQLRGGIDDWLFGCDVCQDVCPWNHKASISTQEEFDAWPENDPVELAKLFAMKESEFRARFRRTPLWRAKRRGILRNAAIVLGNQRTGFDALCAGLSDPEPLVRGACAWSLGQIGSVEADLVLQERLESEVDEETRQEILSARKRIALGDGPEQT